MTAFLCAFQIGRLEDSPIRLVRVRAVFKQIVAGTNYKLQLQLDDLLDDHRVVEAIVYGRPFGAFYSLWSAL